MDYSTGSATAQIVAAQARAMRAGVFDVGLLRQDPEPGQHEMLPRTWDLPTLIRSVPWLRMQNKDGRNIFVRPNGPHALSFVDDLKADTLERMKASGFHPAVIVESSPGNFQAWLHHGVTLFPALSTAAAKALASKFGGDPSSADWRHFGRLAGFTNRKECYRSADGLFPFVKLIESSGRVYPQAPAFLAEVKTAFEKRDQQERNRTQILSSGGTRGTLKTIADFRERAIYKGDGNRIDLGYSVYALAHQVPEQDVRAAIASRDLSHKGDAARQAEYIDRTIEKAWRTLKARGR